MQTRQTDRITVIGVDNVHTTISSFHACAGRKYHDDRLFSPREWRPGCLKAQRAGNNPSRKYAIQVSLTVQPTGITCDATPGKIPRLCNEVWKAGNHNTHADALYYTVVEVHPNYKSYVGTDKMPAL